MALIILRPSFGLKFRRFDYYGLVAGHLSSSLYLASEKMQMFWGRYWYWYFWDNYFRQHLWMAVYILISSSFWSHSCTVLNVLFTLVQNYYWYRSICGLKTRKIPWKKSFFGNVACYGPGTLLKINSISISQGFSHNCSTTTLQIAEFFLLIRKCPFVLELPLNDLDISTKKILTWWKMRL